MTKLTRVAHLRWLHRAVLPAAAAGALALAGCGSSDSGGASTQGAGNGAGAAATTVTVSTGSSMKDVLANADGQTLYFSDQENGTVLCKSDDCTAIWKPLTVPAGQTPSGPSALAGKLTTIMRPDGSTQVALDGKPLYTFSFDHSAGKTDGDGEKDSFDGTDFTWHAATTAGAAGASSVPSSPSSSPNNGGNPYGY